MPTNNEVWDLKIKYTGNKRILHESLHKTPSSAQKKANKVLKHDVPDTNEWNKNPKKWEYVLKREKINSWPIRINAIKTEVESL